MKEKRVTYFTQISNAVRNALLLAIIVFVSACEPWSETAEVSHPSEIPQFELIGGEFQSYIVAEEGEYEDPGAEATANGESLNVYVFGEVDLTEVGVYIITYYAENANGISSTAERVVAVTHSDVSGNDHSGNYEGTIWSPLVEMKVTKLHKDGYYKAEEVMGFPGASVEGNFVDLGDHNLYLVHGEGDFGRYGSSEGDYTLTSLSWTIGLLDQPYEGVQIAVFWKRKTD